MSITKLEKDYDCTVTGVQTDVFFYCLRQLVGRTNLGWQVDCWNSFRFVYLEGKFVFLTPLLGHTL